VKLTENEVEAVMATAKEVKESVTWRDKHHPDWMESQLVVSHAGVGQMKLILSLSKDQRKATFSVNYRGERVRSLDIGGDHMNPAPDLTRFVREIHKHKYTEEFGSSWAYRPTDITTCEPEQAFREFCSECKIDFTGNWSNPPWQTNSDL
jgi:hypothetical protein